MSDIKVTVEPPSENQIVEVTWEGQEIVQPPLTQAEHLNRQATKLDFSSIPDDLDEDIEENNENADDEEVESEENGTQPNKWPWESVRDKLRDALAEVSVLSDVLAIASKACGSDASNNPKRYMMLGKVLNKMSLITFFSHKHYKLQNFIKNLIFFTKNFNLFRLCFETHFEAKSHKK